MKKNIGFIGLGIMGRPMAKNLLKAGCPLYVNDIDARAVEELTSMGAESCSTPAEIAESCSIIFTMLPSDKEVSLVLSDESTGILSRMKPDTILIDMSSISPGKSKELAQKIYAAGGFMFDAPVSGGEPKAIDGTLAFMVGGPSGRFEEIEPLLLKMGGSVVLIGENGSGCVAKLANQVIVNLNIAAMSEALVLAQKCGADVEKVYHAIRGGLAASAVLDAKAPMVLARDFRPGGRIDINLKDIKNVMSAAHDSDTPMPLTSQLLEMFQTLKVWGLQKSDHSALVQYYEKLAQVKVGDAAGTANDAAGVACGAEISWPGAALQTGGDQHE